MLTRAKPPINPFAVYNEETCECVLWEEYKRAIQEAMPPEIEPPDLFWAVLTDIVSKFQIMEKCRIARRMPAAETKRKRCQKIAELATMDGEPTEPLATIKILAEQYLADHRTMVRDFRGNEQDPNREALYMWVLEDLWCRALGQQLGVSLYVDKKRPGPLIKFFAACVNPLLPKPLTANGIVSIHLRAKARRKQHDQRLKLIRQRNEQRNKRLKLIQNWRERTKDQT
jgi:hypothetical protein